MIHELSLAFRKLSNQIPRFFRSPGRINLIGEHTDYNEGFVMPAAIDRYMTMAIALNSSNEIKLWAIDFDDLVVITEDKSESKDWPSWTNYLTGILVLFRERGIDVNGIDCALKSDIPIGAGLSSSAALTCCFAYGLNELLGKPLTSLEIVDMAQRCEHEFAGVKCGIMDQTASIFGKKDHSLLLDCRSRELSYLTVDVGEHQFLLIDTQVKHELSESAYNSRREECDDAVRLLRNRFPQVESIRDVELSMLSHVVLPRQIEKRCRFVVEENARVLAASRHLEKKNLEAFGDLMYASHLGLRNMFEVTCSELDFVIDFSVEWDQVLGSRMMGGGFGGCCLLLIRKSKLDIFQKEISATYRSNFGVAPSFYKVNIVDGTSEVTS